MASEYKAAKEAFVSGLTGSTVTHINLVSAAALSSIALNSVLQSRVPVPRSLTFVVEWLTLVVPLLLSMTLFAQRPILLNLLIIIPTALLVMLPSRETGVSLPSNDHRPPPPPSQSLHREPLSLRPLPALTTYRSHMLLMTFLSILAVDFPIFPRSFAKCEAFGVSLMDIGVGSFVFSQGIVSAIPIIKDANYLDLPLLPEIRRVLWKASPIALLGLIRILAVKGTDYPEHVTEYGVHWNFFLTLAILPVVQVLLHPVIKRVPLTVLGGAVAFGHQIFLSFFGLQDYALHAPRIGLVSSNKEGLVSLLGYIAIHLLGLAMGTIILPPSPGFLRKRNGSLRITKDDDSSGADSGDSDSDDGEAINAKTLRINAPRQLDRTLTELFAYTIIWWALMGFSVLVSGQVSRVTANMPYVFWIAAYNCLFLCGYMQLDLVLFPSRHTRAHPATNARILLQAKGNSSPLLAAVNKNGMPLFLLANVCTGLVNLSLQTMYTKSSISMLILASYSIVVCYVGWTFQNRRLLKL